MLTIELATNNPNKVREFNELASGLDIQFVCCNQSVEVDEDQPTFRGNAIKKVVECFHGVPIIGDDSGLTITALDDWPGVITKRIAETDEEREAIIFAKLGDKPRNAKAVTVLVFYDGLSFHHVYGSVDGLIVEPRGTNGFGFGRIFEINGKTMAEMTADEKNQVSSRSIAMRKMLEFLKCYKGK